LEQYTQWIGYSHIRWIYGCTLAYDT